jgi:hypothetical protein
VSRASEARAVARAAGMVRPPMLATHIHESQRNQAVKDLSEHEFGSLLTSKPFFKKKNIISFKILLKNLHE